jgi:hypothetical protein
MSAPRVFVSYSHESETHSLRVLELCNRLRAEGVDAIIDRHEAAPREGWPLWMERQIELADFVLVVCTENYRKQFEGRAEPGRGVQWEGALISSSLYHSQSQNKTFIPVIFEDDGSSIPLPLRAFTFFRLPEGYEQLYRLLTNQPNTVTPKLGPKQKLTPVRSRGAFSVGTRSAGGATPPEDDQPTRNIAHLLELQVLWKGERLSVVAGAGVGVVAGMPTWADLLRTLLSEFVTKTYSFRDSAETDALIDELQQRLANQSPLIYAQFVRSQFDEDDFIELLHGALYPPLRPITQSPICKAIARLAHHLNCVLTFNYDSLIEDALSSEGFANTPVFEAAGWSSVDGLPVYHPHGYLPRHRETGKQYRVILAESDYHTQYHSPNIWSNIAISRVLLESTCLFVGTSLEDPNLRRLIDASHREQPAKKHYILAKSPVAKDHNLRSPVAQAILEVFAASYQQLGVTPVWFDNFDEIPSIIDSIRDLTLNVNGG